MSQDQLTITVATPAGVFTGTFDKTDKVQDVIDAAVAAKDLDPNEAFELFHVGEALIPLESTLISHQLEDGVSLELVATGSGV